MRAWLLRVGLVLLALAVVALAGWRLVQSWRVPPLAPPYEPVEQVLGVNVSLSEARDSAELGRTLDLVRAGGFTFVRQRFSWKEIEPQPGQYQWGKWDEIVAQARSRRLRIVAVLDTPPEWSRQDNGWAQRPPDDFSDFGRFVEAFARHYQGNVHHLEIWTAPNIWPNWGNRAVDPAGYAELLRVAFHAAKTGNPSAVVLTAALAPNIESGGRNMNEPAFLDGVYRAGGGDSFDALAVQGYGFWTGPDDRRISSDVLNFSRAILLRGVMTRNGDAPKPVWMVEFGWNAVPPDWKGAPSPWGNATPDEQVERTVGAVERARAEWSWLGPMIVSSLRPHAPADDPARFFSMVDDNLQPRPVYTALTGIAGQSVLPRPAPARTRVPVAELLAFGALAALTALVWRLWPLVARRLAPETPLRVFLRTPWPTLVLMGVALAAYWVAPWTPIYLAGGALFVFLAVLRPDLGLVWAAVMVPFYDSTRFVLIVNLSLLELTLYGVSGAALLRAALIAAIAVRNVGWRFAWRPLLRVLREWVLGRSSTFDAGAVAFAVVAICSVFVAQERGAAVRELRIAALQPALLYLLTTLLVRQRSRFNLMVWAFCASGLLAAAMGVGQFVQGQGVVAEGVTRVMGPYQSPNHLGLYLGRVLPLMLALTWGSEHRRWWAAGAGFVALALFLTFSRGAWAGAAVATLFLVWTLGSRMALLGGFALAALGAAGVALTKVERLRSLLDFNHGTSYIRIETWLGALDMARDHPLFGVGLDNFLYQYPRYIRPGAWEEPNLSHPHNIVLDFWLRLGVWGVVVMVWLLVMFFRLCWKLSRMATDRRDRALALGLMASMIAALAHGMVDNSYFLPDLAMAFWLSLAWAAILSRMDFTNPPSE